MNKPTYTYYESGHYYAVITLPNGHTYYSGAFKSRSAAYRYAKRENEKHQRAAKCGMIYNVRLGS